MECLALTSKMIRESNDKGKPTWYVVVEVITVVEHSLSLGCDRYCTHRSESRTPCFTPVCVIVAICDEKRIFLKTDLLRAQAFLTDISNLSELPVSLLLNKSEQKCRRCLFCL
jgi:hypothetical protein